MEGQYNLRSPAVKRLMKEAQELRNATEEYFAQPLEDNLFEWHFTVRGPSESDFDGGLYHGRIILPPDYPMKPPSIILLTPNGRFETHKKICLSISGHHPESWQPSWSIRTALLAIIGFMPTHGNGAIGSLDYTTEERKKLALDSQSWCCPNCGCLKGILPERSSSSGASKDAQEAKELATQISLKAQKENGDTMVLNTDQTPAGIEEGLRHRNVLVEAMATIAPTPVQPVPGIPAPLPPPPIELHQQGPENPVSHQVPQHTVHAISSSSNKLFTLAIFLISFFLCLLVIRRLFFL